MAFMESESGSLQDDQAQMLTQAVQSGDLTPLGAAGDHLAETGFPNAGAVLSRIAERKTGSDWQESTQAPVPAGSFRYACVRDGPRLLHVLRVGLPDGSQYMFTYPAQLTLSRPLRAESFQNKLAVILDLHFG